MYLCQHESCIFFLEAVTWKTNLLSSYLASMQSEQGEAHIKTYTSLVHKARAHFPTTETAPVSSLLLPPPSAACSGQALSSPTALGLAALASESHFCSLVFFFYCYLHCYWQLRFWKGHIRCSHVPTTNNNLVGMLSQPHQVLPPNMLHKGSSHFR